MFELLNVIYEYLGMQIFAVCFSDCLNIRQNNVIQQVREPNSTWIGWN